MITARKTVSYPAEYLPFSIAVMIPETDETSIDLLADELLMT